MNFLSQEWAEGLKEKVNVDKDYLRLAKGTTFKFTWLATDCPGGVDKFIEWELKDAKVAAIKVEEESAPSDFRTAPFDAKQYFLRALGSYEDWSKVAKGEISPVAVIGSGKFKFDGDMMQIMGKSGLVIALIRILASLAPVEY